ncbi:MAG: hypothetical protein AB7U73_01250 [Pirellulales bacterium]
MAKQATKKRTKTTCSETGTMRELLTAIDALGAAQRAIDQASDELAYLPDSYAETVHDFIDALVHLKSPVPFERAEAVALACRVAQIWREWEHNPTDEWPPQTYYALRERLDELVRFPSAATPSPKILADRRTGVRQIAVIWGLFNSAGTPDVDRVERLIAGTEKLPPDWEAADARRAILDADDALTRLRAFVAETTIAPPPPEPAADAPEALETRALNADQQAAVAELLADGMSPDEIADGMEVPRDLVATLAATLQAKTPAPASPPPATPPETTTTT